MQPDLLAEAGVVSSGVARVGRELVARKFIRKLEEDQLKPLMLRSLQGDAQAYVQLLTTLAGILRSYFRHRIDLAADEIEDLVQETLLALHSKRETYDVEQPLTAWLFAIARHKLVDRYRLDAKRAITPLDEVCEPAGDVQIERQLAARDLAIALQELPKKQADAIRCVKLEGRSVVEAALVTGQSVPAVKVGIHRGLKKLVSRFGRSRS